MVIVDVKQQEMHNTELLIRALNRRLESYGKIMYTPEYSQELTHLEQYNDLEKKIYAMFSRNRYLTFSNGQFGKSVSDNMIGRKGDYIQISRSKAVIEDLITLQSEMQVIVDTTPTWQELQQTAERDAGRKLTRKEKNEMILRLSTIKKIESLVEFLGESEQADVTDSKLQDLLKPFRGASKGGTRQKGQKTAQADWDALIDYLKEKYLGISSPVRGTIAQEAQPQQQFDDKFTNEQGLLDFSKSTKSFKRSN